MIRYGLLVPAVVLLVLGGDGLGRAVGNRQQTAIDCAAYVHAPAAMWVRLTGCEIDVAGAGYRERGGRIEELYFPVRPAGSAPTPAPLVVAVRHPSALALARKSMTAGAQPDPAEYLAAMQAVIAALRLDETIDGCARFDLLDRFGTGTVRAGVNAAPTAVVIDLLAEPDPIVPALLAAGGLVLGAGAILATRGSRARARDARAPEAARRQRRLMLLNLGPDADVDAIENAPPLGARATVVDGITNLVAGLTIDAGGRGHAGGPDGLLIDIGSGAVVHTATVTVLGAAGADQLRALLETTGWRAFEPKTGAFVGNATLR